MSPRLSEVAIFWDYVVGSVVDGCTWWEGFRGEDVARLVVVTVPFNYQLKEAPWTNVHAIVVDILAYAFGETSSGGEESSPTPKSPRVVLITANPSFSYGLSILRMRNHQIALMTPTGTKQCLALISQATLCLDWPWDIAGVEGGSPSINASSDGHSRSTHELPRSATPRQSANLDEMADGSSTSAHPYNAESTADSSGTCRPLSQGTNVEEECVETPRNFGVHSQPPRSIEVSNLRSPSPVATAENRSLPEKVEGSEGGWKQDDFQKSALEISAPSPNPPVDIQISEEEPPSYSPSHPQPLPTSQPTIFSWKTRKTPPPPPPEFSVLVEVLRFWRTKGQERPLRGTIALEILARDKLAYKKAGAERFAQYTLTAQNLGIIELGGWQGTAWISLHPAYH